jgi:hypothetical protein
VITLDDVGRVIVLLFGLIMIGLGFAALLIAAENRGY